MTFYEIRNYPASKIDKIQRISESIGFLEVNSVAYSPYLKMNTSK